MPPIPKPEFRKIIDENKAKKITVLAKSLKDSISKQVQPLMPIIKSNTLLANDSNEHSDIHERIKKSANYLDQLILDQSSEKLDSKLAIERLPFKKSINSNSNILKLNYNNHFLLKSDFEKLLPDLNSRQYKVKDLQNKNLITELIKGRYASNLKPNGSYYLVFNNFEDAAVYYHETKGKKINGKQISFEFISSINNELKYMYFPILPDLRISKYIDKNLVENWFTNDLIKSLNKNETNSALITISKHLWEDYKQSSRNNENLDSINGNLNEKKTDKFKNLPIIERTNTVILNNIPENFKSNDIAEWLWEYDLYPIEELSIRKIINSSGGGNNSNKINKLNTWCLIFNNELEARRFILQYDSRHLFENENLPIIKAEILG
ncbi:hypothetical protein B5S33_g3996 [[Candida] boidinii]|nr:hypothetical protein B5S33_g3996 [[Candida] boidinii]